jgi:hypothetical protein
MCLMGRSISKGNLPSPVFVLAKFLIRVTLYLPFAPYSLTLRKTLYPFGLELKAAMPFPDMSLSQ